MSLFVDGVAMPDMIDTSFCGDYTGILVLGQEQDSYGGSFNANQAAAFQLDAVAIYGEAWNAARIISNADSVCVDSNSSALYALWYGGSSLDQSGNGHDAVVFADGTVNGRVDSCTSPAPGMDAAQGSPDSAWTCVGGSRCFRAFEGYLSWDNARRSCESRGAVLATPRSSEENKLWSRITKTNNWYWAGVNDRRKESHFYYGDGTYAGFGEMAFSGIKEGWVYENFNSNEPNDSGNNENCVHINGNYAAWNDLYCNNAQAFVCEIDAEDLRSRRTDPIPMEAGEVRYLEVLGYNNENKASSLLTLTIDPDGTNEPFTTSDILGLSGEFLREIRTDARAVAVAIDGLAAACADGGSCGFSYSSDFTPVVDSIEPAVSTPGETIITLTGSGFGRKTEVVDVDIGGASCEVSACNETFIECIVPIEQGTAGVFTPTVTIYNKGRARITTRHTISMSIDSIAPTSVSLYGGMTLTLTGTGFARFGLHNQIRLLLHDDGAQAEPRGTHDAYDDDWLWQRGQLNGSATYTEVRSSRNILRRDCGHLVFLSYGCV